MKGSLSYDRARIARGEGMDDVEPTVEKMARKGPGQNLGLLRRWAKCKKLKVVIAKCEGVQYE